MLTGVAVNNPDSFDNKRAYSNSWEHTCDEVKRLDLLIRLRMSKQRSAHLGNPLEQFKGLVMSEREIAGLLSDAHCQLDDQSHSESNVLENRMIIESLNRLETTINERRSASLKDGIYLSLQYLSQVFHITPFEEQCLIICLAPELDRKYEKIYAYLQDDITRKKPSIDLVISLLCRTPQEKLEARLAFDQQAPLVKYRLLEITHYSQDSSTTLLSRFIKLDDRITNLLLGSGQTTDARLEGKATLVFPKIKSDQIMVSEDVRGRIRSFISSHFKVVDSEKQNVIFYFYGPYRSGKRSLTESACGDLGIPLIVADVEQMLGGQLPFEEIMWLAGRETVLHRAALCLQNFDYLLADSDKHQAYLKSLLEVIKTFSRLTFLLSNRAWKPRGFFGKDILIDLEFEIPDEGQRKGLWETCLKECHYLSDDLDLSELAGKFGFTAGQIQDALTAAQNLSRWRSPENRRITIQDLYSACRDQCNQKLSVLARKVTPKYRWEDIVLPSDQMDQLREICSQAKYRHIVYGRWGFDRKLSLGKGLNALFSGSSGTGKTMAAEIISNDLCLDLYKIDLSQVVSKYIGETEKNLDKIFTEAQTSNAILFFDEADALFGKRSEVKDAHDRYANIEIGYLLQKMEEYEGMTILATNLRQNMDEAFVRRIQVVVEFPFPDEEYRLKIWEVTFPAEAPLDREIDFGRFAREVKLPGGNIKNIALTAAFYAAEDGGIIRMAHIMRAVRQEYRKVGRIWNEAERSTKGKLAS
jgi:AAA+ superfamily predicted ATPase